MIKKLEQWALAAAGICIVALGGLIAATVITRNLFGWSIPDDVVIVRELMVGAVMLPLAYVTSTYSHIAIEFLFTKVGDRLKLCLLAIGSTISLLSLFPIAMAGWGELVHVLGQNTFHYGRLELPEWPGRLAFFVGAALFVLRLFIIFVSDLRAAITHDNQYLDKRVNNGHQTSEER